MRQQDIQKIIEQVENCSAALKELSRVAREVKEHTAEDYDIVAMAEATVQEAMVATLKRGTDAQLNELKMLIAEINNNK